MGLSHRLALDPLMDCGAVAKQLIALVAPATDVQHDDAAAELKAAALRALTGLCESRGARPQLLCQFIDRLRCRFVFPFIS